MEVGFNLVCIYIYRDYVDLLGSTYEIIYLSVDERSCKSTWVLKLLASHEAPGNMRPFWSWRSHSEKYVFLYLFSVATCCNTWKCVTNETDIDVKGKEQVSSYEGRQETDCLWLFKVLVEMLELLENM